MNMSNSKYHTLVTVFLVPILVGFVYFFGYKIPLDYICTQDMTYVNAIGYIIIATIISLVFLWGIHYKEGATYQALNNLTWIGCIAYFVLIIISYSQLAVAKHLSVGPLYYTLFSSIPFALYVLYFLIMSKKLQIESRTADENLKLFYMAIGNVFAIIFIMFFVGPFYTDGARMASTRFDVFVAGLSNYLYMSGILFSLHNFLLFLKFSKNERP